MYMEYYIKFSLSVCLFSVFNNCKQKVAPLPLSKLLPREVTKRPMTAQLLTPMVTDKTAEATKDTGAATVNIGDRCW